MTVRVPFDDLAAADLTVGTVYEGGASGTAADDPLAKLLPVGNQGGFRLRGQRTTHDYLMAALYTSGADSDWPDTLDPERGHFTYFGDNKRPGAQLHETHRGGNELLRFAFGALHSETPARAKIPPFFVFQKAAIGGGRDIEFLGLAVPGAKDVTPLNDLVAIWRTTEGQRFQNYRAMFTILDAGTVARGWIEQLNAGEPLGDPCPTAFRSWVETGAYVPLEAPRTKRARTPAEQTPEGMTPL